jgi:hypothetical protein
MKENLTHFRLSLPVHDTSESDSICQGTFWLANSGLPHAILQLKWLFFIKKVLKSNILYHLCFLYSKKNMTFEPVFKNLIIEL